MEIGHKSDIVGLAKTTVQLECY